MSRRTLHQLYAEHTGKVSDKWSSYLTEYERLFNDYRDKPVRLLEVGVQNGGSLEIWSKYFSNASALIGCDINPNCASLCYDDPHIGVIVGDANTPEVCEQVFQRSSQFDIIIDDGSHLSSDIIKSFALYFPSVVAGGVFIAEDLHCSYWSQFEGGLFDPYSSISFFKRLADVISHEHWGIPMARADILHGIFTKYDCEIDAEALSQVHSVEFINSMCVVRKAPAADNGLGYRVITGSTELVASGLHELSGRPYYFDSDHDQSSNPWTARDIPPDEAIESIELTVANLNQVVVERDEQIADLNQAVTEREEQITDLNQVVIEREEQITDLNQVVTEREEQITGLNQAVTEREEQITDLNQAVTERNGQISNLYNSSSWKITRPLRFVAHQLKRIRRVMELIIPAIRLGGGVKNTFTKAMRLYGYEGLAGIKRGFRIVATSDQIIPSVESGVFDRNDYTEWVRRYDTLTDEARASMRVRMDGFDYAPTISVVMPTYNPKPEWLIEAIESVRKQIYTQWELCIADDASTDASIRPILERYAKEDSRIKVVFREENGHISAASNSAIELATGEWIALLDNDDVLPEQALFWVAQSINNHPQARLIYSDEDKLDDRGKRHGPYFKCDWNPDLFYGQNMFSHLGVYDTGLVKRIGGFRVGFEGAQDYDLALRCIEHVDPAQIIHIPRVLYHWRVHAESTASGAEAKPYAMLAGERALNEHFQRQKIGGKAKFVGFGYRTHYSLPDQPPLVSLIIPTRNGLDLIKQCIESIFAKTTYKNYEIIIVDNNSDDPETLAYFAGLAGDNRIRVLRDERPFNYSALNNTAVQQARGEYLGLINNDIEVISPEWLDEMMGLAIQPGVGAVGARLWFQRETIQHGGIILGLGASRIAGHAHYQTPRGNHGYFGRASLTSSFSAVSAACLVVRKAIYQEVCGLNEIDLAVAFNDVDFCLRLREAGYRNVWTPYAELYHHESATRGNDDTLEKQSRFNGEVHYMQSRWGSLLMNDPSYSPNLTLDHGDFSYAWPPRIESLES